MSEICKNKQQKCFKISKKLPTSPLINELFYQQINHYNLQNSYEFSIPIVDPLYTYSVFHRQGEEYTVPWSTHMLALPSEFKELNI